MPLKINKEKGERVFKKWGLKVSLVVVGIIVGVGITFLYIQKFGVPFKNILQDALAVEESKALENTLKKVGKLMLLPEDETPAIATILDIDKLVKEEPFYANAQNGDIVLMYQKALKAIIYSPEKDIIVNVGPIYTPSKNSGVEETATPQEDIEQETVEQEVGE